MLQELLRRVSVEWRGEDGESEALVVLADEGAAEVMQRTELNPETCSLCLCYV